MALHPARWSLAALVAMSLLAMSCRSQAVVTDRVDSADPTAASDPTAESALQREPTPTPVPSPPSATSTTTPPPAAIDSPEQADPSPLATPTPTAAPTPTPTPIPQATAVAVDELLALARLEPVNCPPDVTAAQVTCSIAVLPRDVDQPVEGESVRVFVALVDNGDPAGAGPVVFLQGGPGVGSVRLAPSFVGAGHDVLFVDQRGSGYSEPKLDCPESDEDWAAQFSDDPDVSDRADEESFYAAYEACAQRLRALGIPLDDFNTRAAAVDIELLRQLFGYDEWSLWGISYGTRVGLTVMRDFPAGVRSAVLDSIVPFEVDFFATIPEHGIRAINALDAACDSSACAANHGDFLTNLSDLVLKLNLEPRVVNAQRAGTGERFPFSIDGDVLLNMVFTQLYSTRGLRSLPRQISRFDSGGAEEMVANFVAQRDPTRLDLSIALYYSTWCREEFPFHDPGADDALLDELVPLFGQSPAAALSSDGIDRVCASFDVAPAPAIDDEPLMSSIPTLVFAGAFDPITPPAWSQQVAAGLDNVSYVEMPDHGHGMATSCPGSIRLAFLVDPTNDPDISCAAATSGPAFD